ncbi:MAG: glycosyltransferase [Candidatus Electryoneaceae bacterium]|nr:glycosyltransferase [Candidatus Electryoneaceae bacterium]
MFNDIIIWMTVLTGLIWIIAVGAIAIGLLRLRTSDRSGSSKGKDVPTVTVLIAARNEEGMIERCLKSLAGQDYPSEQVEIVVINDHSTDRTADIARGFIGKMPNLRVIDADDPPDGWAPKKNALLNGIRATSGDIILTTDADCIPPTGWISGIVGYFESEVDAVVGWSPLKGDGLIGGIVRFDGLINGVVSAGTIGLGFPTTAVGRNFAYRRSVWDRVGGFGETASGASGDDDLLLQRIAANQGNVRFSTDPATFVRADGQRSLSGWLRMKRRHLSAGTKYRPGLMAFSTALYLFNVTLIAGIILGLTGQSSWWIPGMVWSGKLLVDGLALMIGSKRMLVRGWLIGWVIGEVVTPLLITLLIPASLIGRVRWKGRDLKR